ncbi:Leucine efflux protein [Ephemeroptericola cinctiostellae]|uniref:Leucine efflux protein n=1 Tax=Ephemeroptericola cinctiostellae TaxID=2268024 RepID=A0A345DAY0_9BURK|nr:leucine efflux protein LeuE [Ephemeroptericola cinctiostellae]AXF85518.1 Leucine efflux protein [Ephemeroptericola cinctiostellae]
MEFFTQLGITNITAYLIGTVAIILLPGPNSMYVLTTAAQQGVRRGYAGAAGVFVGDTIIMVAAVIGAATILREAPQVFIALKIAGALYLSYLGINMLIGAWRIWQNRSKPHTNASEMAQLEKSSSPFKRALLISLINPKAILFVLSFFLQFVSADAAHPYVAFLVLGLILQFVSLAYLSGLIFAGAQLAQTFRSRPIWMVVGTLLVGCLFIGFGVKLGMATL